MTRTTNLITIIREIATKNKESIDLDKIISSYRPLVIDRGATSKDFYETANSIVTDKETIYRFVALLHGYQKEREFSLTGYFLSGLINNLDENESVRLDFSNLTLDFSSLLGLGAQLHSRTLEIYPEIGSYIGEEMVSGNIIVHGPARNNVGSNMGGGSILVGSVWDQLGIQMGGGEITVRGSAGDYAAKRMAGGLIVVEKSVRNYLGEFMSSGKVIVKGDASKNIGFEMSGGEIIIEGSMEHKVGFGMMDGKITIGGDVQNTVGLVMKGGEIIVDGNVGPAPIGPAYVGPNMEGGKITIYGDVVGSVGDGMTGGEIHLNGSYGSISKDKMGGRIYHKGKKVA